MKGPTYSLCAVESPDDGGWYCEVYYHADDAKRSILDTETLEVWPTAEEALREGRAHGAQHTKASRPFYESLCPAD